MYTKDLFNIENKTVLVTGGGRGIGLMIAEGFVKSGCKVYISSRKEGNIKQVADKLTREGPGSCHYITADLSKMEGIESLVNQLNQKESKLNVLVNNAGATWGEPFDKFPVKGYDRIFDLNLKSLFFITQKCLPLLRAAASKQDPARVINIGSTSGFLSFTPVTAAYEASKAGVHHLSKSLAGALAPMYINVNAVAYGYFNTDMMRGTMKERGDTVMSNIPMNRSGNPEEAAGICLFLSSKASGFITGAVISVDGGNTTGAKNML